MADEEEQAVNGFKRGKDAAIFPVRTVVTTLDAPVKWLLAQTGGRLPLRPS